MNTRVAGFVVLLWLLGSLARAEVTVVREGKAEAVIVLAEQPTAVAKYAAEELVWHVEKASGARLKIVAEGAAAAGGARIYVGGKAGALPVEGCRLRVGGREIFIAGDDRNGDPLDADTRAGTLWGVYEFLERTLHVRWLWPGELGTVVPQARTIVARDAEETIVPRFFQRKLRAGLGFTSEHPALGFTKAAGEEYAREQSIFLRRHRMGRSLAVGYGHAFTDWWQKYGAEHPEWFQQLERGKRGPAKKNGRFSMCVSAPGLTEQIVENWAAKRGAPTGAPSFINAVENDILGLCSCENCRAWDGPAPADYLTFYSASSKVTGSRFVSDRYARFWLGIQELAGKRDPNATVIGYVYFNYFQAPTSGVKLNENVLLGYCPSAGWFPRSVEEHAWMKAQWDGWRATGARLFMRTNHFLDGYCMPFIFAHQFADEFQHAARNGLVATDYDSLTGHWSTQGPNLYVAARLQVRPEARVDELLGEYYAGFGEAAATVKAYFDYWENYTTAAGERVKKTFEELQASRWRTWAKAAHAIYPPECFASAEKLLGEAVALAGREAEARARVEFLRRGLAHARLCARVAGLLTLAGPAAGAAEGKRALNELIAFRRAHERSWLGNLNHLAWVEDLSWKLSDEVKKAPELYP